MKVKDIFNKKLNKRNNQISLDVRKRKLNEFDIDIEDLMELDLSKSSLSKFKHGGF